MAAPTLDNIILCNGSLEQAEEMFPMAFVYKFTVDTKQIYTPGGTLEPTDPDSDMNLYTYLIVSSSFSQKNPSTFDIFNMLFNYLKISNNAIIYMRKFLLNKHADMENFDLCNILGWCIEQNYFDAAVKIIEFITLQISTQDEKSHSYEIKFNIILMCAINFALQFLIVNKSDKMINLLIESGALINLDQIKILIDSNATYTIDLCIKNGTRLSSTYDRIVAYCIENQNDYMLHYFEQKKIQLLTK